MWYLLDSKNRRFYLQPHKEITFGRRKGDIILENDDSISRLHASIYVEPKEVIEVNEPISSCKLKDLNSKYGTYMRCGEDRVEIPQGECDLKNQDKIQFGLQNHVFTVVYVPIIVVASTLSEDQRSELQWVMDEIDGLISTEWTSNCTHLTVSRAALTEKVTCAMAAAVPIITMAYWEEVKVAFNKGTELPSVENFIPLVDEFLIDKRNSSLYPNMKRRTLFKGLIFVFFDMDQYRMYAKIVNLAGGKSVLYTKRRLTTKEICAPNVIVLLYPDTDISKSLLGIAEDYQMIYKVLHKSKRKMIPETEIPLAIWHCSTEKYCNPKFSFANFLKRMESSCTTAEVLVLDTQDPASNVRELPKVVSNVAINLEWDPNPMHPPQIIPETYDDFHDQETSEPDSVNDSEAQPRLLEPRIIEETNDTFATSSGQETEQVAKVTSTAGNIYIPETNDSSFSNEIDRHVESSTGDIENTETEHNPEAQETGFLKESIVVNNGTPLNDVIDSSLNEGVDLEHTDNDQNDIDNDQNCNDLRNCIPVQETINSLVVESNVESNVEITESDKENCGTMPQGTEEINRRAMRRTRSLSGDSDEEFTVCGKKGTCSENSNTEDTAESGPATSSTSMAEPEIGDSFGRETSSFLRNNVNHKTFKKVCNNIPKTRLTLNDMYVWEKCNTGNVQQGSESPTEI